jgi:hypothetical protein
MPLNDLGNFLVEDCQRINMKEFLQRAKGKLKEALLKSEIESVGCVVEITTTLVNGGGTRFWFICGICRGRKGVLFQHPTIQILGCRQCLNLEYRKRRYRGMIESSIKI